jgi:hypothetical protein
MWTTDFEVFWEWLRIWVVGLCEFIHPSVVENSAFIILRKRMTVLVLTTEVLKCCLVINHVCRLRDMANFTVTIERSNFTYN